MERLRPRSFCVGLEMRTPEPGPRSGQNANRVRRGPGVRRLIVQQLMTADGFVAGTNGELDFFDAVSDYTEVDAENLRILENVDAILLGRNTYRLFVEYWPNAESEVVASAVNTIPKVVFSRTLTAVPWGTWNTASLNVGDPVTEISGLKREQGSDMMLWGSITLAQSLMAHNLVDEYQLRICPVTIGRGLRLFREGRVDLELLGAKQFESGILELRYAPRG